MVSEVLFVVVSFGSKGNDKLELYATVGYEQVCYMLTINFTVSWLF